MLWNLQKNFGDNIEIFLKINGNLGEVLCTYKFCGMFGEV